MLSAAGLFLGDVSEDRWNAVKAVEFPVDRNSSQSWNMRKDCFDFDLALK